MLTSPFGDNRAQVVKGRNHRAHKPSKGKRADNSKKYLARHYTLTQDWRDIDAVNEAIKKRQSLCPAAP